MILSVISDQIGSNFEEALSILKDKGFNYVDIYTVNKKAVDLFTQEDIDYVKSQVDKYGLKVNNIASFGFMYTKLYDYYEFGSTDEFGENFMGSAEEQLEHLNFLFKVAKELNADSVRVFPLRWPENKVPVGTEEDRGKIAGYMSQAAAMAEAEKVQLVLENCPYTHCPKGLMTKDIVKRVNSEYLKMLWDPANSYRADKHRVPEEFLKTTLEDEFLECLPYIKYIHFKDYHYDPQLEGKKFKHTIFGEGDIDFKRIVALMKEKGYDYSVSLEPEVSTHDEILASLSNYKEIFQ